MSNRTKGNRNNKGKARLSLIPPESQLELAKVLTVGADKYGVNNWRLGLSYAETLDAVLRHIMAYQHGEQTDPEDGTPHLANAQAGLSFLIAFDKNPERYKQFDDRFRVGEPEFTDDAPAQAVEPAPSPDALAASEDEVVKALELLHQEDAERAVSEPAHPRMEKRNNIGQSQKLSAR